MGDRNLQTREPLQLQGALHVGVTLAEPSAPGLTLHLLLAKFFLIWALTDSWMFLLRAVSPAILKQRQRRFLREFLGSVDTGAAFHGKPPPAPFPRLAARLAGQVLQAACTTLRLCLQHGPPPATRSQAPPLLCLHPLQMGPLRLALLFLTPIPTTAESTTTT